MGLFGIGETDAEGRQKRIEHRGRYLRASRTGGVALRAQTRVVGVNATANTSQGVRFSTSLTRGTQVALQNGRFVLRGRYGPDAAKLNLSKSGVSVSTKTPVGALNWFRPGKSSFKLAGVQVRGQKAVYLHLLYLPVLAFQLMVALLRLLFAVVARLAGPLASLAKKGYAAWLSRRAAAERPAISDGEVAAAAESAVESLGLNPDAEPKRDLFAALLFLVVARGPGEHAVDAEALGLGSPDAPGHYALVHDAEVAGQQLAPWLDGLGERWEPVGLAGLARALAAALQHRLDTAGCGEAFYALDEACLAAGPRTYLQEAMLEHVAVGLGLELALPEPDDA